MATDLNELARKIVAENQYLTLATVDEAGNPWVAIIAYVFDEHHNFYFISLPTTKHSQLIQKNNHVSFSVFDSQQTVGLGVGLQIEGMVKEVGEEEFPFAEKLYFSRKYPYGDLNNAFMVGARELLKNKTYLFYKIEVTASWINDPDADTDKRVKVNLV